MVPARPLSLSQSRSAADVNSLYPTETPQAVAGDREALRSSSIDLLESENEATLKSESDIPRPFSKMDVLCLLTKNSSSGVLLGVSSMVLGIGIFHDLLPFIFTCPTGATCPTSFDPNSTKVLPILQALMSYWLTFWITVAGFGVVKLCAYQSWFILMRDGNTINDTDVNLAALKGSLLDACRLLFRRGKRFLGFLVVAQIGFSNSISILVGLSISRDVGEMPVIFSYPYVSHLPDSSILSLNSHGEVDAISKVTAWALTNDTSHGPALQGSLVLPDWRSNQSINARAGGPRIQGEISCSGYTDYNISVENGLPRYDINVGGRTYLGKQDKKLAVSMTRVYTAATIYLWISTTYGLIPNSTVTSDGGLYIALCNHTISMAEPSHTESGVQYINPNDAVVPGCTSTDMYICVSDSVNNAVVQFWGGQGQSFIEMSCRGGVLGPLETDLNNTCHLSKDLWVGTVTSVLDAIMQTAPTSGFAPQQLVANVQTLSTRMWWIQGLVPLCTLVLYGVALYYTYVLSQGNGTLKELNLAEVIATAQTDQVRDLPDSGQLERSMIQYKLGAGSIRGNSRLNL